MLRASGCGQKDASMPKPPEKYQPYDPAKAMRERAAARGERPAVELTKDQRWGKRPLLRPDPATKSGSDSEE